MTNLDKKSELTKFTVKISELKNRPNLVEVDVKVGFPYNLPIKKQDKTEFFKRFDTSEVSVSDIYCFLREIPKGYPKENIIEGLINILLKEVEYPENIVYAPHTIKINQEAREQYQLN